MPGLPTAKRREIEDSARRARRSAFAPYSRFRVGAALLGRSGRIYTGCNVENASYGLTICAERTAVAKAVSEGEREFVAIAVASGPGVSPCGACRQVLIEFGIDLEVILVDGRGRSTKTTLKKLLPRAFGKFRPGSRSP
jgi:cytidine deaminase